MKFRTSKELKNMILSINFAILTFFKLFVQFLKHLRVGRYVNTFFFLDGDKIAGSAQKKKKTGSVGLVETRVFFLGLIQNMPEYKPHRLFTFEQSWFKQYLLI